MIHYLKSIMGQTEEHYRQQLWRWKVTTSKDLTYEDADLMIDLYKEILIERGDWKEPKLKAVKKVGRFDSLRNRPGYASPQQLELIQSLWSKYSVLPENQREKALNNFISKRWKIDCLEWITSEIAGKVICALRKMVKYTGTKQVSAAS